jgi:hypothetical protein
MMTATKTGSPTTSAMNTVRRDQSILANRQVEDTQRGIQEPGDV